MSKRKQNTLKIIAGKTKKNSNMVGLPSQRQSEAESWVSIRNSIYQSLEEDTKETTAGSFHQVGQDCTKFDQEDADEDYNNNSQEKMNKKKKNQVLLEGYVDKEDDLNRTKSLTDEDLDELKGCLDLGFGFSYEEIPELCSTLPALELCYSMSQKYLDDHPHKSPETSPDTDSNTAEAISSPVANWKISSPGQSFFSLDIFLLFYCFHFRFHLPSDLVVLCFFLFSIFEVN